MDLLALADFNLVARHGGFGRAARAAGRPKATLSRRVAELEAASTCACSSADARALKLTQEGRALYERTGALLTELDETAAAIASGGETPRGRLRISAPLLFSQTAMGKLAAGFALKYPEVRLEVTTEDRAVDMIEEGYDLVIRVNPDPDESLVGRIFLRDRLVVVASPRLRPADRQISPFRPWCAARAIGGAWEREDAPRKAQHRDRSSASPVTSLIMVRDAVRAGVGAGAPPRVARESRSGRRQAWCIGAISTDREIAIVDALPIAPTVERSRIGVPGLSQAGLPHGDA